MCNVAKKWFEFANENKNWIKRKNRKKKLKKNLKEKPTKRKPNEIRRTKKRFLMRAHDSNVRRSSAFISFSEHKARSSLYLSLSLCRYFVRFVFFCVLLCSRAFSFFFFWVNSIWALVISLVYDQHCLKRIRFSFDRRATILISFLFIWLNRHLCFILFFVKYFPSFKQLCNVLEMYIKICEQF